MAGNKQKFGFPLLALGLACCSPANPDVHETTPEAISSGPIQLRDETSARGVEFVHVAHRTAARLLPEIMGSGVAVADFDRNGAADLYFVGGGDLTQERRPQAARDRLYLNDGKGHFHDASDDWNLGGVAYGMGVACGDFDNDGWVDVLLTSYGGGEQLLRNTGSAFEDVSAKAGLNRSKGWSTGAGFFDCDGDGDLDLYVTRYVAYDLESALPCFHNERPLYCSPALFSALPDSLLVNNGDGTFSDGSLTAGIAQHMGKGLAVCLGDVDWDGDVDIYVANDITRNLLFMNDGKGIFDERGRNGGVAYDESGRAAAGMGADLSDVDANGLQDLVCTNFQEETTNIYMQQPRGVFRDRSYALGVGSLGQQRLSFGVDFLDLDNDGDEDLFVANGHMDDGIETVSARIKFAQQDSIYQLGEDGHFADLSNGVGPALLVAGVTRGLASADFDGDGKLDLVLTNNDGPARLLMNRSRVEGAGALVLWLEGTNSNRSAIGTRLEIQMGDETLRREVRGASSYLSQCDTRVHIGLGSEAQTGPILVLWPDGKRQALAGLGAGFYRLVEDEQPAAFVPGAAVVQPR